MTENVENLVLGHLRHIRGRADKLSEDMDDVKGRLNSLERGFASFKRDGAAIYEDQVRQQFVTVQSPPQTSLPPSAQAADLLAPSPLVGRVGWGV